MVMAKHSFVWEYRKFPVDIDASASLKLNDLRSKLELIELIIGKLGLSGSVIKFQVVYKVPYRETFCREISGTYNYLRLALNSNSADSSLSRAFYISLSVYYINQYKI